MSESTISDEEFVALPLESARDYYLGLVKRGMSKRADELRAAYWDAHKVSVMEGHTEVVRAATRAGPSAAQGSEGGRGFGWILFGLGVLLAVGSFFYDPSVGTSSSYDTGAMYALPERVVNNGKLNVQLMLCIVGSSLMICGTVLMSRPGGSQR